MSDTLTIDQIRSKLRAGELFLKGKQGGKSDVWDKFAELEPRIYEDIGVAT
ncbi:12599_t:CDS:2 [Entrophospora sp. SA101]|nr:9552_t:CDS:2 [Entrophospora sp. SA101]CAJ0832083.1 12599_t:CDS:2 [Entrophospora sp. SA101]